MSMEEKLEVSSCPLCACSGFKLVFKRGIYSGRQCNECNLVYISPRAKDINKIYTDDESSSPSKYYTLSEKHDILTFKKRLGILENYCEPGDFMDIGCSVGNFLAAAEENGWDATGIEPNPAAAESSEKKGFKVEQAFLDESLSQKYSDCFNAAYLGDVIEHVEDPLTMLRLAMKMLKKNGVLMIVTPNFNSYVARKFQIKPLEHIIYFNERSLAYAAALLNAKTELIMKTTRKRSIKALAYSTTFSGKTVQKMLIRLLSAIRLDSLINIVLQLFVKDEVLMILRKQ